MRKKSQNFKSLSNFFSSTSIIDSKCVRLPCQSSIPNCKTLPKYVTYKSLTIPMNFKIPERGFQIFNIKTKSMKVEVEHKVKVNVEHKASGVRAASIKDFRLVTRISEKYF